VILVALVPGVLAAHCTKGIPCGNTCISASKTCHSDDYDWRTNFYHVRASSRTELALEEDGVATPRVVICRKKRLPIVPLDTVVWADKDVTAASSYSPATLQWTVPDGFFVGTPSLGLWLSDCAVDPHPPEVVREDPKPPPPPPPPADQEKVDPSQFAPDE
jgi:hypothetical protein